MQLIISTVLMTPVALAVAVTSLPPTFVLSVPSRDPSKEFASKVSACVFFWGGVSVGEGRGC
jgi:inorganic pyrophosphatase